MEEPSDHEWLRKLVEMAEKHEIDHESLQRIQKIKVDFVQKRQAARDGHEPDLLKKFVPNDQKDAKAIARSILDGSFDSQAEDEWLNSLEEKITKRSSPGKSPKKRAKAAQNPSTHLAPLNTASIDFSVDSEF